MGLRLAKHLGPVGTIDPGQYAVDKPCIFISCPKCGGVDDVSVSHPPDIGGVLTGGRWTCQTITCRWSDYLTLDSWNQEPTS